MPTRLAHIVVDAREPRRLAEFWLQALGWRIAIEEADEVEIAGNAADVNLIFVPVLEPGDSKSRVHLDLATGRHEDQAVKVDRLIALGARRADVGQGDVAWSVMVDPEGNEFCVLPPGYYEEETGPVAAICVTAEDPDALQSFWSAATSWPEVGRGLHRGRGPHLVFGGGTPAPKRAKNRMHIDVAPVIGSTQDVETDRLVALGGRRADIGQGDVGWMVMTDPEGNEFCVLTPR